MEHVITNLVASYGYAIVFLLVAIESLGIPLPGETALLTAAAFAALGHLDIYIVLVLAAAGAIIGDNAGYWIGRTGGMVLIERYGRLVHLDQRKIERMRRFFDRYGAKTVFFGRFVALLRTWAAAFAGAAHMPYPRFMWFNALGGVTWATMVGLLGYVFGRNLSTVHHYLDAVTIGALVLVAAIGGVMLRRRRRQSHHAAR